MTQLRELVSRKHDDAASLIDFSKLDTLPILGWISCSWSFPTTAKLEAPTFGESQASGSHESS